MQLRRFLNAIAVVAVVTYLAGCAEPPPSERVHAPIAIRASPTSTTTTTDMRQVRTLWYALARQDLVARWTLAAVQNAEAVEAQVRAGQAASDRPPAAAPAPIQFGGLAGVVQCIKDHESGDYNEHSHPWEGSGAYQAIPSTWRTWSARAGYGGYDFAYLAPPSVQDAVVLYMLTNGGAGNWSPRYGDDPCTVGMGG